MNTLHSSRIRHFRRDHRTGAEMCVAIISEILTWGRAGQLLVNFFPCLNFQPQKSLRKLIRPSFLLVSYCVLRRVTGPGELPGSALIGLAKRDKHAGLFRSV